MTVIRRLSLALCILVVAGCATGYHDASNPLTGWTGGFWDTQGPGKLIKVGFSGNGFIERDKVGVYVLYRSAEVAMREGKEYFVLYETLPAAIRDHRSTERHVYTIGGKAATYVYILLKDQTGPDVLATADVLSRLKPQVEP